MPTSPSRTTPTGARTADGARAGLTLLELIVVMAILAGLFGIGVGAFRGTVRPEQLALQQVGDALRAARQLARSEGAPAQVRVDPGRGEVVAVGLSRVGNWHFEDEEGTGWPVPAVFDPASLAPVGTLGAGLVLEDGRRLSIPGLPPSFDGGGGLGLEVDLQPAAEGRPMTLLERPGSFRLFLDVHDELRVALWLEEPGGPVERDSGPTGLRLSSERWQHLALGYDGQRLRIERDGTLVLRELHPDQRRMARSPGAALGTGVEPNQYRGRLDELVVSSLVEATTRPLPDGVTLLGGERRLHLDAFGRLDPARHQGPVAIGFRWGDPPRVRAVECGLLGTLRTLEGEAAQRALEGLAPGAPRAGEEGR